MCTFCRSVAMNRKANGGYLTEEQTEQALEVIAKKIKSGTDPEHFQKVLDSLLDTEMAERDSEIEAAWEKSNRGRKDS